MTSGSLSDILKKIITTQTQQFAKETLKKSTICCQKEQGLINTQLNNLTNIAWSDGTQPAPTPVFLLGNSMDRGAWQAIVHGIAKESDTI